MFKLEKNNYHIQTFIWLYNVMQNPNHQFYLEHNTLGIMLRPDSQPSTRFETDRPVLKRVSCAPDSKPVNPLITKLSC